MGVEGMSFGGVSGTKHCQVCRKPMKRDGVKWVHVDDTPLCLRSAALASPEPPPKSQAAVSAVGGGAAVPPASLPCLSEFDAFLPAHLQKQLRALLTEPPRWWLIYFEDGTSEIFTDRQAAEARFKQVSHGHNATLFAAIVSNFRPDQPCAVEPPLRDEREAPKFEPDGDMFWNWDDSEQCHDSPEEVLSEYMNEYIVRFEQASRGADFYGFKLPALPSANNDDDRFFFFRTKEEAQSALAALTAEPPSAGKEG